MGINESCHTWAIDVQGSGSFHDSGVQHPKQQERGNTQRQRSSVFTSLQGPSKAEINGGAELIDLVNPPPRQNTDVNK